MLENEKGSKAAFFVKKSTEMYKSRYRIFV